MRFLICRICLALLVICATSASSFAKYLCAINEVYRCVAVAGCTRVSPRDANLAGVMVLDVQKKQLSLTTIDGTSMTDIVDNITITDNAVLLYGTGKRKTDRTFSAAISLKTGNISAGLSTLDSSFAMSGTCSAEPHAEIEGK
jgi:hypothetical protein